MGAGLSDATSRAGDSLEDQIRARWGNDPAWKNDSVNLIGDFARLLRARGITDLDKLQITPTTRRTLVSAEQPETDAGSYKAAEYVDFDNAFDLAYDGKAIGANGFLGNIDTGGGISDGSVDNLKPQQIAWNSNGKGSHSYNVNFGPDGKPMVVPEFNSSSFWNDSMGDLVKFAALSAGAYGLAAAAPAAGTQATFTANDVAMMAANGMTDAQIAVAVGPEAASGLGLAGPGTGMTFAEATTLAAQQAGTTPPPGNGLQEPAVPPADPATPPPTTQPPGTTPPPGTGGPGLGDVVKVATALTPIIAATTVDPPATPETDDTRFAKMFDAMFADYTKLSARGDDMWNQYLTTFRPLENKFAQTALNYDTATRRETAANDATGQVASEYDQQRQQAQREMTAAGVDPSTMYALNHSSRIVQAKDQAQAANKARNDVEMQGLSLVKSAADFGRGISTTATQQQQVGQNGANAATANATGMANIQNQNTANANQATRDRNQLYGNLFNAIGTGVGMWASSEKKKHMGGKVDGLSAARAIEKSPAKHWRYRDGEGDGNTKARMGPTAEALHKVAPAVSDGKKVDGIAMMGLQHAAIGEISKRMAKIEKRLGLSDMKRRG